MVIQTFTFRPMEKLIRQLGNRSLKELATALCSVVVFFMLSSPSHAEGTKELAPTAADFNKADMHIFDVSGGITRDFMTYIADDQSRLNIEICNPGEIIYFGFNYNTADISGCSRLYYRIKSPSGIIIYSGEVTNTGAGSIGSYAQAVIGPNALAGGAGGYTAIALDPTAALAALSKPNELGPFYIEFNPNDPNNFINSTNACTGSIRPVRLPLFDITVADGVNGNALKGRLWSKAWDLITNSFTNPFKATMYVYADDGIVTNINFNSIQPNGFIVSCNRTGVTDSGNAFNDRKSLANTNSAYGQYRIFLNDPDVDCFPEGIFGKLTDSITVSGCDQNNRCINIPVDKAGDAQLILELNGIPDYQPGTKDRRLPIVLGVGNNCVIWDSRDGLGNIVTPGTTIDIQLDYYNGLTNLPMYDVENHANGFIVKLVRPTLPSNVQPRLFWDDSNIPGGTIELSGCLPGAPPLGCHRWNGTTTAPDGSTGHIPSAYGWGDLHTINTWWYANIIHATATYSVSTIVVDADASNPAGVANKKTVCTTTPTLVLNGSVTGSTTTGQWTRLGGGGSFANPNALNTTYTFSAADYAAGTIKLLLTSTNNTSACPPATDTLTISIIQGPTVNAGGPVTVCANNAVIANLGGSFGGAATGATWTGGTTARFTPNRNIPTAQYTPTAAEISATTLVLTITSTGSGICPEVSATKTITFSTPPTVVMGPDVTVCANNAAATVTATPSNSTSVAWSGGAAGSSFTNGTTNSATYNPAPSEKTAAPTSVTLTFKASKAGCTDASGTLKVNITPIPVMNAGPNRSICANDSIKLVGTRTNAPGSVWSSPTATATSFKPNATSLTTNYKPTAADIANGSVVISLTSAGNNCTPVVSTMTLTITPAPTISAGSDKLVCANNPVTTISATTSAAGVQWYAGPGTYTASNTSNPLTYTLNATEVAATSTGLVVRTTGGTCPPVTDTVFIFVTPAPTVSAGPDLPSCANNATVQVTSATTSAAGIAWSTLNGGSFSNTTIINPFFTPSATDIAAGKATIIITANQSGCLPVRDTAVVIIDPTPIVSAGPNRNVCANKATVTFNGTVTNATGLIWSTAGDGRFSPGATTTATGLTPTYVPGANDISSGGPIIITARSTGGGVRCTQVASTTQLTIYAAPTVSGSASTVCANNAASINLTATAGNGAASTTWSGGSGGTFGAVNNLNTTYATLPAERVAGSIIFTITATKPGCNNVSDTARATITAPPTITAGTAPTVCATSPVANLSGSATVAGGGTWTGAGTFSTPNSFTTTYTPTATEIVNGTASVTITSTGNGNCSPVNASVNITITPPPTVDAGNNQTVCGSNPTVSLAATATNNGAATWTILTGNGSFTSPGNLNTNYTVNAADITRGFVDLRVTVAGLSPCSSTFDDIHISFTPVPSANAGPNQTVCTTDFPVQLAGSGSTGTWASVTSAPGTFNPNSSALNATYTPSASEVAAHTARLRYTTTASAFCPSVSSDVVITIVDGPAVFAGNPGSLCGNGIINLAGTVTGPSTTGGFWSTANGTGSIANPNLLSTTYTISPADITRGTVTFDLASVGSAQCNVVHSTVTYTILAPITVSAGPNQNICGLNGISLNGTSSTGTATWSIVSGTGSFDNANALNAVFTPTIAVPGSVTLQLTTTGNGSCPAQQANVTYNISPAPTVSAGPNQTICADSAYVQLAGTFTVASGIRWSKVAGTGTFAPDSVSINSRYTPSAADRTSGTVTLRATTTGNGICAAVFADMTITITPKVTISAGNDQTLCANNAVATIGGTVSGGSTTGAWTSSSGNAAGFANAAALNTTYTPSATDITNAIVTLTFTSTANGNCKVTSDQMIIHYTPAPVVNAGLPLTACASSISTGGVALNGTITGGSTTGIWSSPSAGSSFTPNNTTLNAHYIPTAADTTAKTVTLTLTSTGNGTCNAVNQTVVVTFSPIPVVNAGPDVTICADSFFVALNGVVANAGGGIWSTTAGAGTFLPSTTNLNANFTPSASARTAHVAVLTLTSTSNGACPAVADNKIITITDAPTVNAGPDITVCANDSVAHIVGASFTIASGVQWISNGSQSFSNATSTTTDYTPNALDISSSPLTLTIRTTGNGMCKPVTDQMTLTITPAPIVSAGPNQTVCADIAGVHLNGAVSAGSTTGTWSTPTTGGTFSPNANTLNAVYNLAPNDITSGTVVLTLTSTGNGLCKPVARTMTINVTPAPTLTVGADQTICADGSASLTSANVVATGVQWSTAGNGTFSPSRFINNPVYTPGSTDTTAHSVILTVVTTGNGTCNPVSKNITLTINPIPIVEAGLNRVVCADVDQINLSASVWHATGGTWIGNGTGTFSPDANTINATYIPSAADISSGNITLTLSATGAGTCGPVSDNMSVSFTPVPTLSAGPDINVCIGTASINVNGSATNASNFQWSVITGTTGGSITAASINTLVAQYQAVPTDADVTLRLTAIPGGGCSNVDDDMHITFSAAPPINAGPDQTVCDSELPVHLNATGTTAKWDPSPTGGTFLPNDQTLNAIYVPSAAEIAAHSTVTLTIRTINNGVCPSGSSTVKITIKPGPTVSAGPDQTICKNVPTVTLAGTKNAVATGINWTRVSSSGSFNNSTALGAVYTPSAADYAAGVATLVITSTGHPGCNAVTDTMQLFVTPEPTLNLGPNITVCGDAVSVPLSATTTNAGTITWSGGAGSFSPANANNTTYTFSPGDPVPGALVLQADVTPVASGTVTCNNVTKTVTVTRTPIPTVNAGPGPVTRCTTTPNVVLNGSTITVATGGIWTSNGTGNFSPSNTTLHPTYVPSAADLLLPSVVLTLTTTGNGQCQAYNSPITINFDKQPTITAAASQPVICSGNTVSFTSSFTNATGVIWSKAPGSDGTFDNTTSTTPVFTPGPNDINVSSGMILIVTTTGPTSCNPAVISIPVSIKTAPVASINAGFDQIICSDADTVQLNGFVSAPLNGVWTTSTNKGIFLANNTDLSAQYIPDPTDKTAGNTIVITLTTTGGDGTCLPASDDMDLSFTPFPTINAGSNILVCADTAYVELNPAFTIATGASWTTNGTGTFAPNSASTPTKYVLSANDISAGVIGFTATTTGNGTCKAYESSLKVTITPKPTLSLGPDRIVCAAASTVSFNANSTAPSVSWSTSGAGSFSPNPNLNTAYSVTPSDTAIKTIHIFAASVNSNNCKAVYDTLLLTFQPKPITFAGPPISSCANVPNVNLVSAGVYNATGGRWSTSGNGNFTSPVTQANNSYEPSVTDRTNGTVTLTFTSTGNGQCGASFSQTTITIAPSPVVTANPALLCDPLLGAPLSGTVTNAGGGNWSASVSGGSFSPSPTLLSATYFPSPAETAAGKAILTLTSTGNGSCNPENASITIVIEPQPIVDAGPDQFTCNNGEITLAANPVQNGVVYTWFENGIPGSPHNNPYNPTVTANTGYILTGQDAKGCIVRDTMEANVFTIPASFNITPTPLCFEENMLIESNPDVIPVQGGTFQWFRDGVLLPGQNKTFINPDVAGIYKIVYFYSNSCTNNASATLNSIPQITTEDVADCNTTTALEATLINPANYPSGVTYNWSPTTGSVGSNTTNTYTVTVVPSDTLMYYVNVTDVATTCVAKDSVYLIGLPVPALLPIDSIACVGSTVKVSARPGNIPDLDQFWNTLSFSWTKNGNADPNTDSLYFVTQDSLYVGTVTIDRCVASVTHKVKFAPYPTTILPDRTKFCDEKSVTLVLDAGPAFKHLWSSELPADPSNPLATTQTLTIQPTQTTKYYVTLTNQFGCAITDSILVRDICEPRLFNPNAFTPGCTGCANNGVFQVYGAHIGRYSISIFNRWGEVIFYTEDMNHSWDGMYLNEMMPVGVYPFIIYYEGTEEYSNIHNTVKGKVTLIR